MLVIKMSFPGGRYHATPWDKHVNEGTVEWPPSPWRLLRAIISTWYTKGDGVSYEMLQSLVDKLSIPPEYDLPPATLASTNHYMPLYRSPVDGKTANVYDAFAHVGDGVLHIVWRDLKLTQEEIDGLRTLLSRMGYLGRAESWTDAVVVDQDVKTNTLIIDDASNVENIAPTLCCLPPSEYERWRVRAISNLVAQREIEKRVKAVSSGKNYQGLSTKDRKEIEVLVPTTLFEALKVDTSDLKAAGWNGPPGSNWVDYRIPDVTFRPRPTKKVVKKDLPTVARYKVRSKVPVMIFDSVLLGEMAHDSLVRLSNGSRTFTGCDDEGRPLKDDHAMVFAHGISKQITGMRVTDLTIYNKHGFTPEDEAALHTLRYLNWGNDVEAVLVGIGGERTFASEGGIIGRSALWTSITPFVPPRCPKFTRAGVPKVDENGAHIGSAEHELRRLLTEHGYPAVKNIKPVPRAMLGGSNRSWLSFRRHRSACDRKPLNEAGFGFEIEFTEAIDGPLALGYGSHFGLGLFRPVG